MQQNNRLTIGNLVEWIIDNRRGKAFEGWTKDHLAVVLHSKLDSKTATYTVDEEGRLTGVVIIEIAPEYKRVHVNHVLTTAKGALKQLIKTFTLWYPGWDIQAYRRDEDLVLYKTDKLVSKIEALT